MISGKIGITLNGGWAEPKTDRQVDKDAAERALQFDFGWYAHPIWYVHFNIHTINILQVQCIKTHFPFSFSRTNFQLLFSFCSGMLYLRSDLSRPSAF